MIWEIPSSKNSLHLKRDNVSGFSLGKLASKSFYPILYDTDINRIVHFFQRHAALNKSILAGISYEFCFNTLIVRVSNSKFW